MSAIVNVFHFLSKCLITPKLSHADLTGQIEILFHDIQSQNLFDKCFEMNISFTFCFKKRVKNILLGALADIFNSLQAIKSCLVITSSSAQPAMTSVCGDLLQSAKTFNNITLDRLRVRVITHVYVVGYVTISLGEM